MVLITARCPVCDWPLYNTREEGCVEGDCSFRPREGSDEWHRIAARRAKLAAQRIQDDARVDPTEMRRPTTNFNARR